ncbi:MAG TPA: TfoX/Sxy family protein [Xanthobacteraceae bacterium]|nr:TfoX/Sxy family protein [Xanthobacteraceae bacterium]
MARASDTFDHIRELFAGFGPVAIKSMFGGAGVYAGETIFAIVIDGVIYLKADELSIPAFEAEGLTPFSYEARKRRVVMSYWRIPDRLYDDPQELAHWSRQALAAAQRAMAGKARGKNKRRKKTLKT